MIKWKLTLAKIQSMFLGTKQNDIVLKLCDQNIVSENSLKLFGVHNLDW